MCTILYRAQDLWYPGAAGSWDVGGALWMHLIDMCVMPIRSETTKINTTKKSKCVKVQLNPSHLGLQCVRRNIKKYDMPEVSNMQCMWGCLRSCEVMLMQANEVQVRMRFGLG